MWANTAGSVVGSLGDVALVEAAFLLCGVLPPPAALALVLRWEHRLRARLAPDAHKPALVQRVVRNLEHADGIPNVVAGRVGQRVVLNQVAAVLALEGGVELHDRDGGARSRRLVLALARDPRLQRRKVLPQRLDLADAAALVVAIFVEREHALFADQFLDGGSLREGILDVNAVVLLNLIEELIRLRMQASGVQAEDSEGKSRLLCVFDQNHIFCTAETNRDLVSESLKSVRNDITRGLVHQLFVQFLPRGSISGGRNSMNFKGEACVISLHRRWLEFNRLPAQKGRLLDFREALPPPALLCRPWSLSG
mmetsp:Transcript_26224/g.45115  ORF Transcript_26224/g.45115 Transcript_26224/m.45115 type:complete len:310 (-) Transcript_26224:173-1102(-)